MTEDRVRVLRLIEYEGPRGLVEKQVAASIHGTRMGMVGRPMTDCAVNGVRITAVTLEEFPEILEDARETPDPRYLEQLLEENRRLHWILLGKDKEANE